MSPFIESQRRKRVKCYIQGSGRWKRKKVIGHGSESPDSTRISVLFMASGDSDRDAEDALSKLLQIGLKLSLQIELLRAMPTTLGETFSLACMTEAHFKGERATTTITNPNDLNTAILDQELEELTLYTSDNVEAVQISRVSTYEEHCCFSTLKADEADNTKPPLYVDTFGNNGGDDSESSGPLWDRISIGDLHGLRDNEGRHNFLQPNAGERMRLQDMVTGRPYQGVGGSPKEATWEWISGSQLIYSLYHLEGHANLEGVGNVTHWAADDRIRKMDMCLCRDMISVEVILGYVFVSYEIIS
uniref:Uncharacterized protein n=1 Tax=Tanacetum cinerariifolium TaxID=118510 RepID=A0A6L2MRN6_TANCI|nr:hypothetical protein [Tanacetum cinerariifolium]